MVNESFACSVLFFTDKVFCLRLFEYLFGSSFDLDFDLFLQTELVWEESSFDSFPLVIFNIRSRDMLIFERHKFFLPLFSFYNNKDMSEDQVTLVIFFGVLFVVVWGGIIAYHGYSSSYDRTHSVDQGNTAMNVMNLRCVYLPSLSFCYGN